MSILTLNLMSYLAGLGAQTSGYHTGEPWMVPAGVKTITLPSGRTETVEPGSFSRRPTRREFTPSMAWRGSGLRGRSTLPTSATSDLTNVSPLKIETPRAAERDRRGDGADSARAVSPGRDYRADYPRGAPGIPQAARGARSYSREHSAFFRRADPHGLSLARPCALWLYGARGGIGRRGDFGRLVLQAARPRR